MPSSSHVKPGVDHDFPADAYEATQPIHGWAAPKRNQSNDNTADLSFLMPSDRPEALGRLDHYQVLELRGHGGFGIVLKAFDEKLHRIVAVKVLAPALAACPLSRKRFLREAQAAAAIPNDHIVGIFAVEDGRWPYIVMEYVDGPSLEEKITRDGPLPLEEVLRIGAQTAMGLAVAHQQGLIHRDIKPGNILLENGVARVKITDFGLARAMDDASLSQAGFVVGTPAYMAPEQAADGQIDHRADLFSLGSVLYTLCTGTQPFRAQGSIATLRQVVDQKATPLREERPDAPKWLEAIITKLHAKNPNRRYQSAQEVAEVLLHHLGELRGSPPTSPSRRGFVACVLAVLLCGSLALALHPIFAPSLPVEANRPAAGPPAAVIPPPVVVDPPLALAPFNAAQAREHQKRWAERLKLPVEHVNSIDQKLVLVPPGEFIMGGDDGGIKRSQPIHAVRISQAFYCGVHEVTVGQFRAFADATGYKSVAETDPLGCRFWNAKKRSLDRRPDVNWRTPGFPQSDQHPACCLSYTDGAAFCQWLTHRESKTYRLPTEAEWEYACRAGTQTLYNYGSKPAPERMNGSSLQPTPVGSFPPNAFGLFDMHGNLYEWCLDSMRTYAPNALIDPRGPVDVPVRVTRGGGYSTGLTSVNMTSFARNNTSAEDPYAAFGFRIIRECR